MEVQRYDLCDGAIEKYEYGDYVTYADYLEVCDELAEKSDKLKTLRSKIKDLFMEM
jgi:hypothetical protein